MEVNAKGGEWGGGQQDEGGGWVQVCRSFPKKHLGSGVGKTKLIKKSL